MTPLVWLIAGLALAVAELAVGDLTLLMLGGASLAATVPAALGGPIWLQVLVFAAVAITLLFGLRPVLRRRLAKAPQLDTSPKALEGQLAEVLETVGREGQVRLDGTVWSARSLDPSTSFHPGERVRVISIEGTTAVVWKEF